MSSDKRVSVGVLVSICPPLAIRFPLSLPDRLRGAKHPDVAGARLAALEAGSEGVVRQVLAVAFPNLGRYVGKALAAAFGVERRDEAASVVILVRGEVSAGLLVMSLLRVSDTDPPTLRRRVQSFRPVLIERLPRGPRLFLGVAEHEDDGTPVRQRVLVEVDLVFRKALLCFLLELACRLVPADRAGRSQERRGCHPDSRDRADPRHEKPRCHCSDAESHG